MSSSFIPFLLALIALLSHAGVARPVDSSLEPRQGPSGSLASPAGGSVFVTEVILVTILDTDACFGRSLMAVSLCAESTIYLLRAPSEYLL